jgi:hypothetical protein
MSKCKQQDFRRDLSLPCPSANPALGGLSPRNSRSPFPGQALRIYRNGKHNLCGMSTSTCPPCETQFFFEEGLEPLRRRK